MNLTKDDFWISSATVWLPTEKPTTAPNFTSTTGDGAFPSEYWFGEDEKGKFVIRHADHWGRVQNCFWFLNTETGIKCVLEEAYAICYFSSFLDIREKPQLLDMSEEEALDFFK